MEQLVGIQTVSTTQVKTFILVLLSGAKITLEKDWTDRGGCPGSKVAYSQDNELQSELKASKTGKDGKSKT